MKKFLKFILIFVVSVCVIVIAAGYVLLTQIDFNAYKNSIIKIVYEKTGRQLTMDNIRLRPSFNPIVEVQNVTFSNATWAKSSEMVSAQSIELGFALLPLFQKKIEIDTFTVHNAVVNLEINSQGKANWEFSDTQSGELKKISSSNWGLIGVAHAEDMTMSDSQVTGGEFSLSDVVVRNLLLDNVQINYTDTAQTVQSYKINNLKLTEADLNNINFDFNVNDGLYTGTGIAGGFSKLENVNGYPVQGQFDVMGIQATTDVLLYDLMGGDIRFKGNVSAQGFLGKNSGYNESVNANIEGNLKKIKADIQSLMFAGNQIKGTVSVDLNQQVPAIRANLNSDKIDLASFTKKTQSMAAFSLVKEAKATTLVPNEVIPYQYLSDVDAKADVYIGLLSNANVELAKDLTLQAEVVKGILNVKLTKGMIFNGDATAAFNVNASQKSVLFKMDVKRLNLKQALAAAGDIKAALDFRSGSETDIVVNLIGQGDTFADVVDTLNGHFITIMEQSQLHIGNIGLLKGNIISQLLDTLRITKGNDDLNLRCAVVRADLKDGMAQIPNGITVNADKFTIVATGDVNLKKDELNLSFKPFAGKLTDTNIAKVLSSLVKLTGTIQNPKIRVDSANAIKTIVGVTTTGPVYLGSQMLLENDGSPCYTALQGTGYENRFPKPENVVTQTTNDVGQIFDDSVGVVKDTTKGIIDILSGSVKSLNRNK